MRLEIKSEQGRKKASAMIQAGADIFIDHAENQMLRYGVIDTGDLYKALTSQNLLITNDSAQIDVTFAGTRTRVGKRSGKAHKTRNAAIGFIQQFGRKYGKKKTKFKPGRPFFTDAAREAKPQILAKWQEMMGDEE